MSRETIARRYAQAIFELGVQSSSVSSLTEDFRKVAAAWQASPALQNVVANPLIEPSARLATMRELCDRLAVSPVARNAVGLLTQRSRLPALPAIARELARMSDERAGLVRVTVTSAVALSDADAAKLQAELEARTGKKVLLERKEDPSLIAGMVARIGDRVIDGSALARLERFKSQFLTAS